MQTASPKRRPQIVALPAREHTDTTKMAPDEPILLRVEEAARLLGYGRSTVYEMITNGELAAIRRGRTTRIPRKALDEWVSRALTAAAPQTK